MPPNLTLNEFPWRNGKITVHDRSGKAPYIVLIAGQAADLITTYHFMHSGGTEANRFAQSPTKATALKIGGNVFLFAVMKMYDRIAQRGKSDAGRARWAARILGYGAGTVGASAALHNELGTPTIMPIFCR